MRNNRKGPAFGYLGVNIHKARNYSMSRSNVQKGGALLDDARRVVEVWDLTVDAATNLSRIAEENLLAKPSRARGNPDPD